MKTLALLLFCLIVPVLEISQAATNATVMARTTGRIVSATLTLTSNKADPAMFLAYQCDITPGPSKVKSPVLAFHFVTSRADGGLETMSGWVRRGAKQTEDMVEYALPQEKSRIEPLVPADKLRTVKGRIRHHPTVQFGAYGKIILYRVELWLDGELLDVFESKPAADAKAASVPSDWFKKVGILNVAPVATNAAVAVEKPLSR